MLSKIFISVAFLMYGVVVPVFEINATHVFNPEWAPHARLHEVWQLVTNTSLGLLCLWLAWVKGNIRAASALGIFIMGGFLLAYATRAFYGGSMVLSDGSEKMLLGLNLGVLSFTVGILLSLAAIALERR